MKRNFHKADPFLLALERAGFEAYLVGGCVRDLLLDRPVHDLDLTTNARPEEVARIFSHTVPTGIRHGTVTAILEGQKAEITTYRTEGAYLDARHPSSVAYVQSLAEDLRRRDFTINAMAMDLRGEVTDLFGGREDLRQRIIRCVGDPEARFREDALRIIRAYRFAAQLDFRIDGETAAAVHRCAPLCDKLSAERVRDEVEKMLCSAHPERLAEVAALGILTRFGVRGADYAALRDVAPEREVRWAAWRRMEPGLDLRALRLEGKLIRLAEAVRTPCRDLLALKRCIAAHGWEAGALAAKLDGLDLAAIGGDCVTLQQLAVKGTDLAALSGAAVGHALHAMLEQVLLHPAWNERETLLAWYFSEGRTRAEAPTPESPDSRA